MARAGRPWIASALAVLMALSGASAARAELRTGSAANRFPQPELSSPIRPELNRAAIRYDDQAGSLAVTISLYDPLADPSATSALRPWRFEVLLGDYLHGICSGHDRTWLSINGALGEGLPVVLDSFLDFENTFPDVPVTKTLSPDRTQIQLSVTNPGLRGLGLICASVEVFDRNDDLERFSDTFAFLFDGFDPADGALGREVVQELEEQAGYVARLLDRHGTSAVRPSCRELYQATFSCRAHGRLRRAPGRPVLTLRGQMEFDRARARRFPGGARVWRANMRARLSWRRCPADTPRKLRGKPCHIAARWRGAKRLTDALGLR